MKFESLLPEFFEEPIDYSENIALDFEEDDDEDEESISLADIMGQATWFPGVPAFYGAENRSVLIAGPITENVANTVISQLMQLQSNDPQAPIKVLVNTLGGDAASGFALYDWMRCLTTPVISIAYGRCSSAGLPILMGGDFRLATPRTRFFYHEVIYGAGVSSHAEADDHRANYSWYQEEMEQILWQRTSMNKTQWKRNFQGKTSFHFSSSLALELGIIHDLLEENDKRIQIGDKKYGKQRKRRTR